MEIVSENQFSGKTYFYTIASRAKERADALVAADREREEAEEKRRRREEAGAGGGAANMSQSWCH